MSCRLTPMDEPLGRAVGNALEVAECVEVLQRRRTAGFDRADTGSGGARSRTLRATSWRAGWTDGSAWRKFVRTGGSAGRRCGRAGGFGASPSRARFAIRSWPRRTARSKRMDAEAIGRASVLLGGGRQKADDAVDFAVGFSQIKKVGESVAAGEPLAGRSCAERGRRSRRASDARERGIESRSHDRAWLILLVRRFRDRGARARPDAERLRREAVPAAARLIPWLLEEKEQLRQMPLGE